MNPSMPAQVHQDPNQAQRLSYVQSQQPQPNMRQPQQQHGMYHPQFSQQQQPLQMPPRSQHQQQYQQHHQLMTQQQPYHHQQPPPHQSQFTQHLQSPQQQQQPPYRHQLAAAAAQQFQSPQPAATQQFQVPPQQRQPSPQSQQFQLSSPSPTKFRSPYNHLQQQQQKSPLQQQQQQQYTPRQPRPQPPLYPNPPSVPPYPQQRYFSPQQFQHSPSSQQQAPSQLNNSQLYSPSNRVPPPVQQGYYQRSESPVKQPQSPNDQFAPLSPTKSNRLNVSSSPSNDDSLDNRKGKRKSASSLHNQQQQQQHSSSNKTGTLNIKRSEEAPVTLQGWLYKQGSEGLMLWKKRWFVLSEFCLFYYKSPDEERVSGSILLPSYKISPTNSKEDGISKKFAFKAEHKNMRTYYFAAETKDSMIQWMNAMSLASILQQENNFSSGGSGGIQQNNNIVRSPTTPKVQMKSKLQSPQQIIQPIHNHPPAVAQIFSPNGNAYLYHPPTQNDSTTTTSNLSPLVSPSGPQPLYANAPPKPRRMNTSRDQSPSPERVPFHDHQDLNHQQQQTPKISPKQQVMVTGRYHQPLTDVHQAHIIVDDVPPTYRMRPAPQERRTPEAYGRMAMMRMPPNRMMIDYEDIYNQNMAHMMAPNQFAMHQSAVQLAQTGSSRQQAQRPHSAEFLDRDNNHPVPTTAPQTPNPGGRYHARPQPPRPKSSIEQRVLQQGYMQEESANIQQYRSQSRASAVMEYHQQHTATVQQQQQQQQHQNRPMPLPSPHDSQLDLASEEVSRYFPTPSPRKSVPTHIPTEYQNVPRRQSTGTSGYPAGKRAESVTPMVAAATGLLDNELIGEFKRSNSARLHRNKRNHPEIFGAGEDKRREQREESMKRLLEWKQRMLQSPLTRKSSRNASRTQTPTNSDSPIPSFVPESIKGKLDTVVAKMNNGKPYHQVPPPPQTSGGLPLSNSAAETPKRVSRKGSTGSRSSRSRSSPRITNRIQASSSDEEDQPRQIRKRSKSQQSRGSRSSSMNKLNQEQPEYINISSLDDVPRNNPDLSVVAHSELMPALPAHNRGAAAIGPDAWYNDDFDYDKSQHTFGDDPLLKHHYGQLLDMRSIQGTFLDTSVVEMEHKPVLNQRSKTWHGDNFAELQMFEKNNSRDSQQQQQQQQTPVLLKVSTDADLKPRLPKTSSSSKENWSPTKAIDEIRKVKEAPPKNVVQDRRRKFEENLNMSDIEQALDEAQKEIEDKQKKHQEIVKDFALSDSNKDSYSDDPSEPSAAQSGGKNEKKRSVLELLSDFERKSQKLQEEEIKDRSGARRRVFSDTETMMYDTSSDEESSSFEPLVTSQKSAQIQDASRKSSLPTLLPSTSLSVTEETYLPMMSSKNNIVHQDLPVEQPYLAMSTPDKKSAAASSEDEEKRPSVSDGNGSDRRPSQSMIMEHLIKEFGPEKAASILENFETSSPPPPRKPPMLANNTSSESHHNYCEIPETIQDLEAATTSPGGHYEYLFKATSSSSNTNTIAFETSSPKHNYESVYQEIPEDHIHNHHHTESGVVGLPKPPSEKMLPDIVGNAPTGKNTSSDDAEEEVVPIKERSLFEVSGTFTPASFYLDKSESNSTPSKAESLSSRELPETPTEQKQKISTASSSAPAVPFKNSFLKKEINLTYQSVYENEDISSGQSSSGKEEQQQQQPPKVPYYVSDIKDPTKKRRAQTPDAFLSDSVVVPQMNQDGVMRSKSLEGLLGDGHAAPRDSIQVSMHHQAYQTPIASPLPARGHDPPPPPPGVPPLDLSHFWQTQQQQRNPNSHDDDATWRESLRRASAKHQQYPTAAARPLTSSSTTTTTPVGPHINGYIWDQRDQRFYRLNADPNPNPRLFKSQQPFLDQGLPTHTNSEDSQRIQVLLSQQRPMSVGPLGSTNGSKMESGMMGRPSSTLPISAHQRAFHAPNFAPSFESQSTTNSNTIQSDVIVANREAARQKRRTQSFSKRQRLNRNILDITAQDLLGKSHDELVLLLIHLRRQSVALNEAIDGSKAELENLANAAANSDGDSAIEAKAMLQDAQLHLEELQVKLNRTQPMINLVDNMVKLGSLYNNGSPADSHMKKLNNNNGKKDVVNNDDDDQNYILESELKKVHNQLELNHRILEDLATEHSKWELQMSMLKKPRRSSSSIDTLQSDIKQVQQNCSTIKKRIQDVAQEIQVLHAKQDFLTNEIRPSPTGVAGAEPVPSKKKNTSTWFETDIDNGMSVDRSNEIEDQIKAELKAKNAGSTYINAYEEDIHNYENTKYSTTDEDEIQTVHSEGIRSEAPPLPPTRKESNSSLSSSEMYSLGDISEADERVKKFYGLLPKQQQSQQQHSQQQQQTAEVKTVRMVKRDSKERSRSQDSPVAPLPPRGNYQNVHDFLNGFHPPPPPQQQQQQQQQSSEESVNYNIKANTLPRSVESASTTKESPAPSRSSTMRFYDYGNKKERSNSVSAYERLFGSSRETSLSPPESPSKQTMIRGSSGESSLSPIMSPVFKSDAAKEIIQEVGVGANGHRKIHRRVKKRSMTITSSHPSMLEALQNHAEKLSARSRDDLDMEQALGPRGLSTPDVIKSALNKNEVAGGKLSTNAIDNLFGAPDKIVIPERYVPDADAEEISPEERQVRLKKADSIRKMLAEQSTHSSMNSEESAKNLTEEKKQREQLLALNQVIAQQVMEKRKSLPGNKSPFPQP